MQQISAASHPVWIDQNHCSMAEFKACVERTSDPITLPLADDIQSNIPIYDAAKIRAVLDDTAKLSEYMAEWNHVFKDGAGITVFRNTFDDVRVIDKATEVLNRIIDQEATESAGSGDHFAAAGSNTRVWNAHEKLCLADPEAFARYNANSIVPLVSRSWLGPFYQITTQVNVVHPGGTAQIAHRDYHMGFQTAATLAAYPAHVHALSAALTLQGAVAHSDMPIESGPTKLLPFSQSYLPGYLAAALPEFQDYFETHYVQLALHKGDAMFFNPAVFHAAGENKTSDIHRFANLMQIGSGYGRSIEIVDRGCMSAALYPVLLTLQKDGVFTPREMDNIVAACAEGYPFPVNLDLDSPLSGMAPPSQQDLLKQALQEEWNPERVVQELNAQAARKRSH